MDQFHHKAISAYGCGVPQTRNNAFGGPCKYVHTPNMDKMVREGLVPALSPDSVFRNFDDAGIQQKESVTLYARIAILRGGISYSGTDKLAEDNRHHNRVCN